MCVCVYTVYAVWSSYLVPRHNTLAQKRAETGYATYEELLLDLKTRGHSEKPLCLCLCLCL